MQYFSKILTSTVKIISKMFIKNKLRKNGTVCFKPALQWNTYFVFCWILLR